MLDISSASASDARSNREIPPALCAIRFLKKDAANRDFHWLSIEQSTRSLHGILAPVRGSAPAHSLFPGREETQELPFVPTSG